MELLSTVHNEQTVEIYSDGSVVLDPHITIEDLSIAKIGDNYTLRETVDGHLILARKWY
jgi:imidazoleglycerol phosphate dehydratase HisB